MESNLGFLISALAFSIRISTWVAFNRFGDGCLSSPRPFHFATLNRKYPSNHYNTLSTHFSNTVDVRKYHVIIKCATSRYENMSVDTSETFVVIGLDNNTRVETEETLIVYSHTTKHLFRFLREIFSRSFQLVLI